MESVFYPRILKIGLHLNQPLPIHLDEVWVLVVEIPHNPPSVLVPGNIYGLKYSYILTGIITFKLKTINTSRMKRRNFCNYYFFKSKMETFDLLFISENWKNICPCWSLLLSSNTYSWHINTQRLLTKLKLTPMAVREFLTGMLVFFSIFSNVRENSEKKTNLSSYQSYQSVAVI